MNGYGYDVAWAKREAVRREARERSVETPAPADVVRAVADHAEGKEHDHLCEGHLCHCVRRRDLIARVTRRIERGDIIA